MASRSSDSEASRQSSSASASKGQADSSAAAGAIETSSPAEEKVRKKPRYTKGTRRFQRLERGMARATRRVAQAVEVGVGAYISESDRKARKVKDGSLRYLGVNVALGMAEAAAVMAKAPNDIAKRVSTRPVRRLVRTAMSSYSRFSSPFRM